MSVYRMLTDHSTGWGNMFAGTIQSTADVGGRLPAGWIPDGGVDPLDPDAVQDFFNAGPQACPPIKQQWAAYGVSPPVTYWVAVPGLPFTYQLTGLGGNLGPAQIGNSASSAARAFGSIGNP